MLHNTIVSEHVLTRAVCCQIVNVPQPQTPYNSSKAAVKHMAASLGWEWAKMGVRVNALRCVSQLYISTEVKSLNGCLQPRIHAHRSDEGHLREGP